ncbi:MAG: hypothetical protein K2H47_11375, partial [Muribaculaceae bacterium]|nr:hypothetical protein [Muribaculaceae bacterium]
LFWGIAAGILTIIMTGLSKQELSSFFSIKEIAAFEFIEVLIFIGFVFFHSNKSVLLRFYPGLMIAVPLALVSSVAVRLFPGTDFNLIGVLIGLVVFLTVGVAALLCRYLHAGKQSLYLISLIIMVMTVVIYGMA